MRILGVDVVAAVTAAGINDRWPFAEPAAALGTAAEVASLGFPAIIMEDHVVLTR